jgi:hypothetical protein
MSEHLTKEEIQDVWAVIEDMEVEDAREYLASLDMSLLVRASEGFAMFIDGVPDRRRLNVATQRGRVVRFMGVG